MAQRDLTHLSAFLDQLRPLIPEPAAAQFNLLNILQVSSREVPICRLLAALMEPNGAHGLGVFPMQQFLTDILGQSCPPEDFDYAYLELEDHTDANRRVDIALYTRGGKQVFPIEVKIWAEDQDQQLCDYYHYYEHLGHALPAGICYLTPYGTCPSQKSIGDLRPDQIRQIADALL